MMPALRPAFRLRVLKLCLELDCQAVWPDAEPGCPACGGRESVLLETFVNRPHGARRPAA